ncbi:MAG: hypothetical protein MI810_22385 [Flavobacteriales bacterium]|nr:hypothetical protein [Flavobacteriales bacterium]
MYDILVRAHSGWRWIVLILVLTAIFKAFQGRGAGKEFTAGDKKIALFAMVAFHIQFLVGLILYFLSPMVTFAEGFMKSTELRFYTMEHSVLMILAMVFITMGYSKSKKQTEDKAKFSKIAIFYTIALILVLAAIPWPFRIASAGWF